MSGDQKTDINVGFATLLRSREGLLVRTTVVNKEHLRTHLVRLDNVSEKVVESLVDPADKQNVPKAVALIQHLSRLRDLNTSSYTPSQLEEHHALVILGEAFDSFMRPFIDVQMSLTQQLTSLIKYVHLTFFMYRKHGTQFMTSALYSDSQATVKDILFCVAKQKVLDSSKPFYIIQVGSDCLEACFCNARTQTHHRNFDILELSYKLAVASVISSIYLRNPELDAGSRRLNLTDAIGVDHVNPKSWIGDVTVDNVSLQRCWQQGKVGADAFLSSVFPPNELEDSSTAFSHPNHDLLRPFGAYIGFSGDTDPSDEKPDDGPEQITCEASGEDQQVEAVEPGGILVDDEETDAIELEEMLPDVIGDPILGEIPRDWLEIDGVMHRKSSVVAQRLKANRSKKVVERTLRVQGVTIEDLRKHSSANIQTDAPESDHFCVGDVAATLVRSGSSVCLAIIQAIAMWKNNSSFRSVATDLLRDRGSDFSVRAQVIQLVQSGSVWAWPPHQFLMVSKPKKQSSKPAIHNFTITCPGWLCFPVNPDIQVIANLLPNNMFVSIPGFSPDRTWVLPGEDLGILTEHVWGKLKSDDARATVAAVEALPLIENSGILPYEDQGGKLFPSSHWVPTKPPLGVACFIVDGVRAVTNAPAADKNSRVDCLLCGVSTPLMQMRAHVGQHILRHLYGMKESDLKREVCGTCIWYYPIC